MDGLSTITLDDFARRFALRAPNLMWLLGAGASASAGIATAWDMIWDFKRQLYCSVRGVSPKVVEDLSNPAVRRRLQDFVDGQTGHPAPDSPEEYAHLFEAVYPSEIDRRTYIDGKVSGASPSYGHVALATLMRAGRLPIVWSTNFDSLVTDAAARVYGTTSALTTVALDAPDLADQAINAGRLPVEIKLHGDFRSRRLKNTTEELRTQDRRMRANLKAQCARYGLVVAGYSGRDESIMEALDTALEAETPFPNGLFWLTRGEPLLRVSQFLERAVAAGVEAALVPVEQFDEVLVDLIRLTPDLDTGALDELSAQRRRRTPARTPNRRSGWPVVRTNALPVLEHPATCRLVDCTIGDTREVRSAVEAADAQVLAVRSSGGVLAFGSDPEVRRAFADHDIAGLDLHSVAPYKTTERGLLRDALALALIRDRPLQLRRRRDEDLIIPTRPADRLFAPVDALVPHMTGTVPGTRLPWAEGVAVRLEFFDNKLWLLVEPRPITERTDDRDAGRTGSAWARERTARRYNRHWNDLVAAWAGVLVGDGEHLRAYGVGDGVDAAFRLSATTAYSRRGHA